MAGRASTPFRRTDRVFDVVFEVWTRDVLTIPTRREEGTLHNSLVAMALWECGREWVGWQRGVQAIPAYGHVFGSIARRISVGRAGDHPETRRKLVDFGFGATVKVVDAPI